MGVGRDMGSELSYANLHAWEGFVEDVRQHAQLPRQLCFKGLLDLPTVKNDSSERVRAMCAPGQCAATAYSGVAIVSIRA